MSEVQEAKVRVGPGRRIAIFLLSALLTVLLFWLCGFIVEDIGDIEGPDREAIFARHVDQALVDRVEAIREERAEVERQIEAEREDQRILETSMQSSRQVMDQLMQLHRLSLERDVTPTEAEQTALAESESLFLTNQQRFQEANERVAALSQQQRALSATIRDLEEQISDQQEPAQEEYQEAWDRHQFRIAALKLAVLVPLLLIAGWLVLKKRRSAYAPILWAALIAVFWRMTIVMWDHFPREFFRYIAIGAGIVVVLAFLITVIRTVTAPRPQWLLRQRRDSYQKRRCPVCAYPIAPAVLARMGLLQPGLKAPPAAEGAPEPHACPACGTALFEKCESCGAIRHSLLPHCSHCRAERPIGP